MTSLNRRVLALGAVVLLKIAMVSLWDAAARVVLLIPALVPAAIASLAMWQGRLIAVGFHTLVSVRIRCDSYLS
jgi:hypothetical protein